LISEITLEGYKIPPLINEFRYKIMSKDKIMRVLGAILLGILAYKANQTERELICNLVDNSAGDHELLIYAGDYTPEEQSKIKLSCRWYP
jgi:hypothetical protein